MINWILISFLMSRFFLFYGYMFYMFIFHRDLSQNITDTSLASLSLVFSLSSLASSLIPILTFSEHVPSYPHSLPILPSSDLSCKQKDTCDDSYLFSNAFRSRDRVPRHTSIFRVSSRRQFSRGWWRQTTIGWADAPEMSSRGKIPRCWKQ